MPIIYEPPAYAAPTYDELVEEILGNLQGYTLSQDLVASLTQSLSTTDTVVHIAMPEGGLGIGTVEVGDELMYVASVDEDGGTLNLLPRGRGWRGTTPSAHSLGDTLVVDPLVPRWRVKKAINDTINASWPLLFGIASSEFTYTATNTLAWVIPAEAEFILDVRYKDRDGNWQLVRHWSVLRSSNTTDFSTGVSLRITCSLPHGATVRVIYAKRPQPLTSGSAPFTDTGLTLSAKDVLVMGAMSRLVPALDAGRLGVQYVPADEMDQQRQVGAATALAREFERGYQAALLKEQQALQNLYPARVHFQR